MLVDPEFSGGDSVLISLGALISNGRELEKIDTGLYLCPHFNFNYEMKDGTYRSYRSEKDFFSLKLEDLIPETDDFYFNEYGVCDSPTQFMEKVGKELIASDRLFVVSFTRLLRKEQDPDGGWRWHKWGPYIGNQSPQCEYLYDEKDIDEVYTYHVYEIIKKVN